MSPNFEKPFKLVVDVSDVGCGVVLLQEDDNEIDHAVNYFLYKCTLTRKTAEVLVHTDHNLFMFINHMRDKNQGLLRWSVVVQEYIQFEINQIQEKDNIITNALF